MGSKQLGKLCSQCIQPVLQQQNNIQLLFLDQIYYFVACMDTETKESGQISPASSLETHSHSLQPSKQLARAALTAKEAYYKDRNDPLNLLLCNLELYFARSSAVKLKEDTYNKHSIIPPKDSDRQHFTNLFRSMKDNNYYSASQLGLDSKYSRGVGAVVGMAIADALGASTQFIEWEKKGLGIVKSSFCDIHNAIMNGKLHPRSGKIGIWTDDASMGLSMADSILLTDYNFDPQHLRYMFHMWLQHGLNNGGRPYSIGLGGNISISMYEFMRQRGDFTAEGDRFNNGNGSLMRLAPVPVAYSDDLQKGILYSGLQSLTTHNGAQAEECSRLMANIIIELINRKEGEDGKEILLRVCDNFKSPVKSVQFLARGQQESQEWYLEQCRNPKFKKFNKSINDRNWNWREKDHVYAETRLKNMPGYIGSYCMDGLSMALHTIMFTDSFLQAVAWNADMGGDCDTVGSIAGQIAGALYGVDDQMLKLYSEMQDFKTERYDVFLKALKLALHKKLILDNV